MSPRAIIRRHLDPDHVDPYEGIVDVVADIEDTNSVDLPPLWPHIGDLLEDLYNTPPMNEAQACISFTHAGFRIMMYQDGTIDLINVE